ncbi:basic phospholipase A2 homolog 1-like [Lytechinus pictus]|uniref:basic phospholipase A2 homolog 1-like n=1 Tax=Lytechinus pictus TaxID=7653 RepID=UPI0030B9FDC4
MYLCIFVVTMLALFASGTSVHKEVDEHDEDSLQVYNILPSCGNALSLRYGGYGCFCRSGGSGLPVDDMDKCCQEHGSCYSSLKDESGGSCSSETDLSAISYSFECRAAWSWFNDATEKALNISCNSDANDGCQQALCDCDKTASLCFAANEYNPEYTSYDKKRCEN